MLLLTQLLLPKISTRFSISGCIDAKVYLKTFTLRFNEFLFVQTEAIRAHASLDFVNGGLKSFQLKKERKINIDGSLRRLTFSLFYLSLIPDSINYAASFFVLKCLAK